MKINWIEITICYCEVEVDSCQAMVKHHCVFVCYEFQASYWWYVWVMMNVSMYSFANSISTFYEFKRWAAVSTSGCRVTALARLVQYL